jgi:hypothetical protein
VCALIRHMENNSPLHMALHGFAWLLPSIHENLPGGARRLRFASSSPVEFASKIGIHHFIDARRFKWRSTRWPASLLTNQCW